MQNLFASAACVAFLAVPSLSFADQIGAEWQSQRDYYNAVTDRVCEGDIGALEELNHAAWELENGVALHNIAWIYSNQADCPTAQMGMPYDADAAIDAQEISAFTDYPVGQFGYGMMLIEGRYGVPQNPGDGVGWLDASHGNGFARATEELALIFAQGLYGYPQDAEFARMLVQQAQERGLSERRLAALRSDVESYLSTANSGVAAAATVPPGQTAPAQNAPANTSGVVFQVMTWSGTNQPSLGDQQSASNYTSQVVYVAEGFNINRGQNCWTVSSIFMIGQVYLPVNEYSAGAFERFLETSEIQRASGDLANLQFFTSLDEGIAFREQHNNYLTQEGEKPRWTLAEVEGMGEQCSSRESAPTYPIPVRDQGY